MKPWTPLTDSLALLSRTDQRKLILVTAIQMLTALLDVAGVALFGVVAALATASVSQTPLPSSVQRVIGSPDSSDALLRVAIQLSIVAGLLLIVKSLVSVLLTRRALRFLAYRQAMVAGRLAAALLSRPLLQVQRRSSQESAFALTNGVNNAVLGVLGQGVTVCSELSLLAVLAVGLVLVDPVVAIFAVAFFVCIALVLQRIMSTRAQRLGQMSASAEVLSTALVQESVGSYRELLVSHRRNLYVDRFREQRWQAAQVQADLSLMALVPKYVFEIALIVGAGLLAWSQFVFKDAAAAMATIVVFLAAGSRVVPSMLRLQGATLGVRVTSGMAQPTIELARELDATTSGQHVTVFEGVVLDAEELGARIRAGYSGFVATIDVQNVEFSYDSNLAPALHGVSFSAPAGTSVALVGPTGAGKSTLADAILGVVQPDAGSVRIGGLAPLEAASRWPGGLAYVPQTVAIATGTIRQNVALGLPPSVADDERVWEALERARLADFLKTSRDGLDTVVGEMGMRLSGGQRQRLGIARALYTRPRMMVLDEATSALDAETEKAVVDTLAAIEGEITTVTIAHRLATVRHCDLVIYLEGGTIVAQGRFEEVVATVPNFAEQTRLLGLV